VEYLLRVYAAPEDPDYGGRPGPWGGGQGAGGGQAMGPPEGRDGWGEREGCVPTTRASHPAASQPTGEVSVSLWCGCSGGGGRKAGDPDRMPPSFRAGVYLRIRLSSHRQPGAPPPRGPEPAPVRHLHPGPHRPCSHPALLHRPLPRQGGRPAPSPSLPSIPDSQALSPRSMRPRPQAAPRAIQGGVPCTPWNLELMGRNLFGGGGVSSLLRRPRPPFSSAAAAPRTPDSNRFRVKPPFTTVSCHLHH